MQITFKVLATCGDETDNFRHFVLRNLQLRTSLKYIKLIVAAVSRVDPITATEAFQRLPSSTNMVHDSKWRRDRILNI